MEKNKLVLRSYYIREDQDKLMTKFKDRSFFSKGDVIRASIDFFFKKESEGKIIVKNGKIDFV